MNYNKWPAEVDEWLQEHQRETSAELVPALQKVFAGYDGLKPSTLQTHRELIKATHQFNRRKALPLYSERMKNGVLKIKVAQPAEWKIKTRWVYEETHPEELGEIKDNDVFIRLDEAPDNYEPANICRVSKAVFMLINRHGGLNGLTPEEKKIKIARMTLRRALLVAGEAIGVSTSNKGGRYIKEERAAKVRAYRAAHRNDEAYIAKRRAYERAAYARNPEKAKAHSREAYHKYKDDPEYRARRREYSRNYYHKNRDRLREKQNEYQRQYRAAKKAGGKENE